MDFNPSQDVLFQMMKTWQKRLRLEDWKLAIRFSDSLVGCKAMVTHYPNLKAADIEILTPGTILAKEYEFTTFEKLEHTVVHELLHLHFSAFKHKHGSVRETLEEQAVECIAQALTIRKDLSWVPTE